MRSTRDVLNEARHLSDNWDARDWSRLKRVIDELIAKVEALEAERQPFKVLMDEALERGLATWGARVCAHCGKWWDAMNSHSRPCARGGDHDFRPTAFETSVLELAARLGFEVPPAPTAFSLNGAPVRVKLGTPFGDGQHVFEMAVESIDLTDGHPEPLGAWNRHVRARVVLSGWRASSPDGCGDVWPLPEPQLALRCTLPRGHESAHSDGTSTWAR